MKFANLASRLFNQPLAIHPQKAEMLMAVLASRMGVLDVTRLVRADGATVHLENPEAPGDWERSGQKPYSVTAEGVATIDVCGTLVQKLGSLQPYSGMTGYDGIRACFLDAWADPKIKAIALNIDSPGGEVAGCFDLVDTIAAARGRKPIHAILTECAYSAAYAIASAADRISVPRTGGVGSIGVIAMLVDLSKALASEGITVNLIQFGARKADGSEFIPLEPEARARFQQQIDQLGALFVNTVSANRKLSASVVRATEAATFQGADGVRLGLADAVASPDQAYRALVAAI